MRFQIHVLAIVFISLSWSNFSCGEEQVSYNGYKLFRITPTTPIQLEQLRLFSSKSVGELDFWLITTAVNQSADVMVPPKSMHRLMIFLNFTQIPSSVLIDDLGEIIRQDSEDKVELQPGFEFFTDYNNVDEINQYFFDLVNAYPDIASFIEIGSSYEGRPLQLLRISTDSVDQKPAIWIQGGAHAREQIGPAVVAFIARELVRLFGERNGGLELNEMINVFDWYILPVLNPDGYEYTQIDRLWRKTRSRHLNITKCIGVDANRNWDIAWNDVAGSSSDPCSHNYAGPKAFSEPETKAVSNFMMEHLKGRLKLFVDFHSYSQRWLSPWGYISRLPPNYSELMSLAEAATKALEKVNGTKYSVGSTGNILYTVTGGARDWVYDIIGAPHSYVVELRDTGKFGFLLPRRMILPTALETWEAIKAMGLQLQKLTSSQNDLD